MHTSFILSQLLLPPRPQQPAPETPSSPAQIGDPEALIREARQLQRRRQTRVTATVVALAAAAGLVYGIVRSGGRAPSIERVPGGPTVNIGSFAGHGRLAFISRNTVWVLDGDSHSVRRVAITRGLYPLRPSFSPDGRWLAFVETTTQPAYVAGGAWTVGQLWLARGDGSDAHPIAGLANAKLVGWSSRTDVLAVVAGPVSARVPFGVETTVRLVTPDGNIRRLLRDRYVRGAVWSPDGRELAVVTEDARLHDTLATYPINGGQRTIWQRFNPHTHLNGMGQILVDPAGWWPDFGIGIWIYGNGMTHNNDATPLHVVSHPGAAPRYLADTLSDQTTRVIAGGRKRLAVVADVSHGVNGNRLVWDAKQLQICTPNDRCAPIDRNRHFVTLDPGWSPRGDKLAFIRAPDLTSSGWPQSVLKGWYADHQLRLYDPPARTTQTLAEEHGATVPIWSVDGRSMLFVDRNGIWLLPRVGAAPVEIASPLFGSSWPAYYGQMAWPAQFGWSSS
jgi:hypothetical protein